MEKNYSRIVYNEELTILAIPQNGIYDVLACNELWYTSKSNFKRGTSSVNSQGLKTGAVDTLLKYSRAVGLKKSTTDKIVMSYN